MSHLSGLSNEPKLPKTVLALPCPGKTRILADITLLSQCHAKPLQVAVPKASDPISRSLHMLFGGDAISRPVTETVRALNQILVPH